MALVIVDSAIGSRAVAPAAPVVSPAVHPPVPAAELPPLLQPAAKKTPFWKKELTLSRGAKTLKEAQEEKLETVAGAERTPYRSGTTFDLLPSGPTGTYWADGIPLGSTLRR